MIGVALAAAVAGWLVAAYFLWQSVLPDGLRLPDVDEDSLFPTSTLSEARSAITLWKEDYNHRRPHSALGNVPPAEFAMKSTLEKQAA